MFVSWLLNERVPSKRAKILDGSSFGGQMWNSRFRPLAFTDLGISTRSGHYGRNRRRCRSRKEKPATAHNDREFPVTAAEELKGGPRLQGPSSRIKLPAAADVSSPIEAEQKTKACVHECLTAAKFASRDPLLPPALNCSGLFFLFAGFKAASIAERRSMEMPTLQTGRGRGPRRFSIIL